MDNNQPEARQRILNASIRLFARKGYAGTSVRDIVREAGINIAMISYYFKGKKGILEEIMSSLHRDFNNLMNLDSGIMSSDKAILDKLESALIFFSDHPDEVSILLNEVGRDDEGLRPIKDLLQDKLREISHYFVQYTGLNEQDTLTQISLYVEMWFGMIFSGYLLNLKDFFTQELSLSPEELEKVRRDTILKITRKLLSQKETLLSEKYP